MMVYLWAALACKAYNPALKWHASNPQRGTSTTSNHDQIWHAASQLDFAGDRDRLDHLGVAHHHPEARRRILSLRNGDWGNSPGFSRTPLKVGHQ